MKQADKREPRITKDGSSTVFSEQFGQHYHNPNGAVDESRLVFFERSGLYESIAENKSITILETGFGTGLNFLIFLDSLKSAGNKADCVFESVEAFPLTTQEARHLNYEQFLGNVPETADILAEIFSSISSGMNKFLFDNLELRLWVGDFEFWKMETSNADVIFHDPFSPEANPELWTPEVFAKLWNHSSENVVLCTYCAASRARAAMAKAGWYVARARGALGKREMTLASRSEKKIELYKRVNEERLISRFYPNS